jgi:peptide methionine sulfoxide reductase MsrB
MPNGSWFQPEIRVCAPADPAVAEAVELRSDYSLFMRRTEVVCRRCGPARGGLLPRVRQS